MACSQQPPLRMHKSRFAILSMALFVTLAISWASAQELQTEAHPNSSVQLAHNSTASPIASQRSLLAAAQGPANSGMSQFQECGAASLVRPKIVLIGDSHTERGLDVNQGGWVQKLQWWFNRKVRAAAAIAARANPPVPHTH